MHEMQLSDGERVQGQQEDGCWRWLELGPESRA